MNETVHDLLFAARRSVRYHTRRSLFFDRLNLSASAVSVLFGSAAMAALLGNAGQGWVMAAAGVVTLLSTINLVVGSTRMARLHADLARDFVALEKTIVSSEKDGQAPAPADWLAKRLDIEAEEPPVLRVLDTLCHNDLLRAMGYPVSERIRVRWGQAALAQFFDLSDDDLQASHAL